MSKDQKASIMKQTFNIVVSILCPPVMAIITSLPISNGWMRLYEFIYEGEREGPFPLSDPGMAPEKEFIDWFQKHGGWLNPKVNFKDYSFEDAGRGMVALDDIKVNTH